MDYEIKNDKKVVIIEDELKEKQEKERLKRLSAYANKPDNKTDINK